MSFIVFSLSNEFNEMIIMGMIFVILCVGLFLFKQISFGKNPSYARKPCPFLFLFTSMLFDRNRECDRTSDETAFNRMWQMIKYSYEKAAKFDIDEWPNT